MFYSLKNFWMLQIRQSLWKYSFYSVLLFTYRWIQSANIILRMLVRTWNKIHVNLIQVSPFSFLERFLYLICINSFSHFWQNSPARLSTYGIFIIKRFIISISFRYVELFKFCIYSYFIVCLSKMIYFI